MTVRSARAALQRTGAFSQNEKDALKNALAIVYADMGAIEDFVGLTPASLTTGAAAGILAGVGTVYDTEVRVSDGDIPVITTKIFIDLTGLGSSTTDLDIIGTTGVCHIGRITTAQNGVIYGGQISCLETPATGADDIDISSSLTATDEFDAAVTSPTVLLTSGGAWVRGVTKLLTATPAPDAYIYLINGEAGVVGTYTAGKFIIELWGSTL